MDSDIFIKKVNGRDVMCYTIATYHENNSGKDFIIYTDKTYTDDNKLKLYYSLYENIDSGIRLIDIFDKNDEITSLKIIETVISEIKE